MECPAAAARARMAGDYAEAERLHAIASDQATTVGMRLHLEMRRVYCLVDAGRHDEAIACPPRSRSPHLSVSQSA